MSSCNYSLIPVFWLDSLSDIANLLWWRVEEECRSASVLSPASNNSPFADIASRILRFISLCLMRFYSIRISTDHFTFLFILFVRRKKTDEKTIISLSLTHTHTHTHTHAHTHFFLVSLSFWLSLFNLNTRISKQWAFGRCVQHVGLLSLFHITPLFLAFFLSSTNTHSHKSIQAPL